MGPAGDGPGAHRRRVRRLRGGGHPAHALRALALGPRRVARRDGAARRHRPALIATGHERPHVTLLPANPDIAYSPFDVVMNVDPYPTYKRLRDEAPIYYNETYNFWALSRHADVEAAFANWEVFSSSHGDILEVVQSGMPIPRGVIMWQDPPEHTKHRNLLSKVFIPRRMAALEDQVRLYCTRALDPFVGADRFDFVEDLGREMPMRVIGMLLGIPEADQPAIRDRVDKDLR